MRTVGDVERRSSAGPPGGGRGPSTPWLQYAWFAVVLIPVFFVVAFAVGEGMYAAMGYDPGFDAVPLWVGVVCVVPTLAVFLLPCAAAVFCGRRAYAAGDRRGRVPTTVAAVAGAGVVVLTLLSL